MLTPRVHAVVAYRYAYTVQLYTMYTIDAYCVLGFANCPDLWCSSLNILLRLPTLVLKFNDMFTGIFRVSNGRWSISTNPITIYILILGHPGR